MKVGQILRKEKLFLMKITLLRDTAWQKFYIFFVWHWKKKNVLSLQYTATQKCSLKAVCHNLTKWYNFDCLLFCHAQTNRLTRHHYLDKMRPVTNSILSVSVHQNISGFSSWHITQRKMYFMFNFSWFTYVFTSAPGPEDDSCFCATNIKFSK